MIYLISEHSIRKEIGKDMSRKNDKIKSALEIALEKARNLDGLSTEEWQRLKEKELVVAGESLARRYLDGLPLRDLEVELGRHREGDRQRINSYLMSNLIDAIDMETTTTNMRIFDAIQHLSTEAEFVQSIRCLIQEYEGAKEKARKENLSALEAAKRNELELRGISGSAVEPAIETSPEWLQIRHQLESRCQKRLEEIKHKYKNI